MILTLKGCIERRIKKDQNQGKEEEIKYNQETAIVFEKKEQNEKQGTNKNIKRKFEATTEEKREIRIVYETLPLVGSMEGGVYVTLMNNYASKR